MKVFIMRHPGDLNGSEVDVKRLHGFRWDCVSGGYRKSHAYMCVYAYIPYEEGCELVSCSGLHAGYGHDMKVCLVKSENTGEYLEGYKYAVEQAGGPLVYRPYKRPEGMPPCTKRILQILETKPECKCKRQELRKQIVAEGYEGKTFSSAILALWKTMRVDYDRRDHYKKQVVEIF